MLNNKIKVAIVGIGDDALSVYNLLKNLRDIEIASFFNLYDEILPSNLLKENNIVFHNSLDKISKINGLSIVINTVKDAKVEEKLKQIRGNVSIIETGSVNLMVRLFQEKQELIKNKKYSG